MAIINTLRNKMGKVLVVLLALVMIAFVGGEFFTSLGPGTSQDADIAEMAGSSISNTVFQNKVDELSYNFSVNSGRNPLQQETEQIRSQAWNAMIIEKVYKKQFDELGLIVSDAEQIDLVQGGNISPQVVQFFSDPQTGQFSVDNVKGFLSNIAQAPLAQQLSWSAFEESLVRSRLMEKYNNLFTRTNYVNKYEAKDEHTNQNASASIEYVYVPFSSLSDSLVTVTDTELKKYVSSNSSEYKREESRDLEYVIFELKASSTDSTLVKEEVADFKIALESATNDSSYVSINSDDPYPFITYTVDNLPAELKGQEPGFVSEPTIVNGAYEFYKLSRKDEITSDSILYRVAKMKKGFFISDETINESYRQADLFAASAGNVKEFRNLAEEQGLKVLVTKRVPKNAARVGVMSDARSIVLWLYNEGEVGAVSEVKEIGDRYVVAAMTGMQKEGIANLDEVRNQVERKVRNEKKSKTIIDKMNGFDATDFSSVAGSYGTEAKSGSADYQLFSNSISGVGYAPEAIGLSFALNDEEATKAFAVQDGVMMIKLTTKDIPADVDDYSSFALQVSSQRLGPNAMVADFPLSYFRLFVSRSIDDAVKEFAEIEDMRYKFF